MSKTVLYMSMSVDGFVAGPNVGPGNERISQRGQAGFLAYRPARPRRRIRPPAAGDTSP